MKALFLIPFVAFAQSDRLAADYPVHADLDHGVAIGAEYLVHTLPATGGALVANDFLVVDVGLIGPKNRVTLSIGQFTLRVNGKAILQTQTAGMVSGSMTFPEWSSHPTIDAQAGPAVISSRPSMGRFPGDTSQHPLPAPQSTATKEAEIPVDQRVQRAALPEGEVMPPVRGLIFFPFRGKTKSIKSLELIYEGPAGKAILKFF